MFPEFHFKITHKYDTSSDKQATPPSLPPPPPPHPVFNWSRRFKGRHYWRVALKRGWRLFQKKKINSYEIWKQISVNNNHCDKY